MLLKGSMIDLSSLLLVSLHFLQASSESNFDPTRHLGGNGPWYRGANVFNIPYQAPEGCTVDTAAFVSRHGSRYPDPSAYSGWKDLYKKIQNAIFTAQGSLAFLDSWKPVVREPEQELSKISIGGYKELYDMGVSYRFRYPEFYKENTVFSVFANQYPAAPRVVDSARLFARGYMGPNSTLGDVYVLKSSDPRTVANSLAPSDLCPNYHDNSAGDLGTEWNSIYLPSISRRLNKLIDGDLNLTDSDVSNFPYLCGFETQITGSKSPFCDVFTKPETLRYEYAQGLRYYYGNGPGSGKNSTLMLPVLNAIVERLTDGPNKSYINSAGQSWTPSPLIAMFTNDGQLNQLASEIGVFDDVKPLPKDQIPENNLYNPSNWVTMRGTLTFERLSCANDQKFVRTVLNDVVYPLPSCKSGPGQSCPLAQYAALVAQKNEAAGDFTRNCGAVGSVGGTNGMGNGTGGATASFLRDNALAWEYVVKP